LLADFVANLDRINAIADASDGFRWRLVGDGGNATSLRPFGDDVLVNMSVWRDLEALRKYVNDPAHLEIMKRRREWFARASQAYAVLWWVAAGHRPTIWVSDLYGAQRGWADQWQVCLAQVHVAV